jgi:hypothetical protein
VSKAYRLSSMFTGKVSEFAESTLKAHKLRKGAMAPQEMVCTSPQPPPPPPPP